VSALHPKRRDDPDARRPTVKNRDLDTMLEAAWNAGWWAARKKGQSHVKCYSPDGQRMVTVASTPSDHRTIPNTRSAFRRAGLKL